MTICDVQYIRSQSFLVSYPFKRINPSEYTGEPKTLDMDVIYLLSQI